MDWIYQIQHDENTTLKEVYILYKGEVINWLSSKFNIDSDDATDIFQTSVIIFYDNVMSGKLTTLTCDLKFYLQGIGQNLALQNLRSSKKLICSKEMIIHHIYSENFEIYKEEDFSAASAGLKELGESCQKLLELYYYKSKSMEEITHILGYKNRDTTKNQKYKCLLRLQNNYCKQIFKYKLN